MSAASSGEIQTSTLVKTTDFKDLEIAGTKAIIRIVNGTFQDRAALNR